MNNLDSDGRSDILKRELKEQYNMVHMCLS